MTPFTHGPWEFADASLEEIGIIGSAQTSADDVWNTVDGWRLVSVRRPGETEFKMFALGFIGFLEEWAATPPIAGFDQDRILTKSFVLRLGRPGEGENPYLLEMVRTAIEISGALR